LDNPLVLRLARLDKLQTMARLVERLARLVLHQPLAHLPRLLEPMYLTSASLIL
jgi:hypothetical protein